MVGIGGADYNARDRSIGAVAEPVRKRRCSTARLDSSFLCPQLWQTSLDRLHQGLGLVDHDMMVCVS